MPFRDRRLLGIDDQELRRAVLHAQADAVRPEQREQRHGDRAQLDRAEHRDVERARRLEHDGDAVAGRHALRGQVVRELRRLARDVGEGEQLVAAVGVREDHRGPVAVDVPVDAFVRDVERVAVAVEQLPQLVRRPVRLGIGVGRVFGEFGHGSASRRSVCCK